MSVLISKKIYHWYLLMVILVLLTTTALIKFTCVIINITSSMPKGVYLKTFGEIGRGDIVTVCLKNPYRRIGLKCGYIGQGSDCSGSIALIKKVIAIPNDDIELTNGYIAVNHYKLNYPTYHVDSKGRSLSAYPRGKYLHSTGYWLIGTNDIKSWDSRYFGPVTKDQILNKLKPLIVW